MATKKTVVLAFTAFALVQTFMISQVWAGENIRVMPTDKNTPTIKVSNAPSTPAASQPAVGGGIFGRASGGALVPAKTQTSATKPSITQRPAGAYHEPQKPANNASDRFFNSLRNLAKPATK